MPFATSTKKSNYFRYLDADNAKKSICNRRLNTGGRRSEEVPPASEGEPPNLTLRITCYLS